MILDKPVQRELLLAYILNDIDKLLKNLNLNDLIKGFSDLVNDFDANKADYFYKYYKATRQAEKDLKKEEKKKK